jgi:hypothetical protein
MTVQLVTTVLVAPSSYLLVDLDTVKEELGIPDSDTSNDDWLTRVLGQVSRSIGSYCNRVFPIEQLQDVAFLQQDPYPYQVPGGVIALQLARWPLANLAVLPLAAAANGGDTTLNFGAGTPLAGLVSGPAIAGGTTATVAGNLATLSQPVTAPMAAGTPIGFGISVVQTIAGSFGGPVTTQALSAGLDYQPDAKAGQLLRLNPFTGVVVYWEALPTTVVYSAGYATIPEDVVVAALRWVSIRWWEHKENRDPMLRSFDQPMVGTKTWWVGGPKMTGTVPEEIAGLLSHYRTPVVA